MELSRWRSMWVIALFDLPVDTKDARRQYQDFRKSLLKDGFAKMQYSVYIRHCASLENAEAHMKRVESMVPPDGEVRLLMLTDKQFERMRVFWGEKRVLAEEPPAQLELF